MAVDKSHIHPVYFVAPIILRRGLSADRLKYPPGMETSDGKLIAVAMGSAMLNALQLNIYP
jgi:hypothetical protein